VITDIDTGLADAAVEGVRECGAELHL